MFNQLKIMVDRIDVENSWPGIWGAEDRNWYDGIAYYYDINTWQRYSRCGYPIEQDEMCKYGKIYKVERVIDWPGELDYHYKILSERPDTNENDKGWMLQVS